MLRSTVTNYEFEEHEQAARLHETRNIITKRPLDCFKVLPHQRIITVRDPRSVITSKHKDFPGYFIGAHHSAAGTPGLCEHYEAIKELDGFRLKYEDLVADPVNVQNELQPHFDFEYSGKFTDFHKQPIPKRLTSQLNGIREVDGGHDWRNHMERIIDQFEVYPELFDIVIELGYEKDRGWYENR